MNNLFVPFQTSQSSFVCTQSNGFNYCYVILRIQFNISHMVTQFYETLTGTTTAGQSGPGSNGNKEVLHVLKTPKLGPHHQMV